MVETSVYHRSTYLQHTAQNLVLPELMIPLGEEWKGQSPNRFTTNKRHVTAP